jgi:molybdopterin molybdotransferase
MDPVDVARQKMCSQIGELAAEAVSLDSAAGRVLRASVSARRDQPPFRSSAMDGYALRRIELDSGEGLRIVGVSAAGARYPIAVSAGEAVRIFTGASVPDGADCVVPQEDVTIDNGQLRASPPRSDNIRARGVDFVAGSELIASGTRLDAFSLSLAAAAGHAELTVSAKPRVALLTTGNELVVPGASIGPDQIFESVSFGLAALIEQWGGVTKRFSSAADTADAIGAAARTALEQADLLVIVGGASVGEHDLAKTALAGFGLEIVVRQVAMKPGKPTWFGRTALGPVLGLPGNPVAALVSAYLFLHPLLDRMLAAHSEPAFRKVRARCADALPVNGRLEHYVRAHVETDDDGRLTAHALKQQDTSVLSALSQANGLIVRPVAAPAVAAGELVDVMTLAR